MTSTNVYPPPRAEPRDHFDNTDEDDGGFGDGAGVDDDTIHERRQS